MIATIVAIVFCDPCDHLETIKRRPDRCDRCDRCDHMETWGLNDRKDRNDRCDPCFRCDYSIWKPCFNKISQILIIIVSNLKPNYSMTLAITINSISEQSQYLQKIHVSEKEFFQNKNCELKENWKWTKIKHSNSSFWQNIIWKALIIFTCQLI